MSKLLCNKTRQILKDQLARHEGIKLTPYFCTANKLTIGIGRNLEQKGISLEEADTLLDNDVSQFEQEVYNKVDKEMGINLLSINDERRAVLINMAFNLGVNGLCKFKNMLSAIKKHDYELAAKEMLNSRWATQVGDRADELAQIMRTGKWTG